LELTVRKENCPLARKRHANFIQPGKKKEQRQLFFIVKKVGASLLERKKKATNVEQYLMDGQYAAGPKKKTRKGCPVQLLLV
jgi:hypothetical protein